MKVLVLMQSDPAALHDLDVDMVIHTIAVNKFFSKAAFEHQHHVVLCMTYVYIVRYYIVYEVTCST